MGNFTDNGRNGMGLDVWGPVLNMNRDQRWGRNGEGGTEDPYLMGELGIGWTNGLQKNPIEKRFTQVAATLKVRSRDRSVAPAVAAAVGGAAAAHLLFFHQHYDANSLEDSDGFSRHSVNANLSNYLLADYYWVAFRAAITKADAKGVMCSYNAANGIPTCLSPLLKAARVAWNFTGYVTSDSDSVAAHHYVKTGAEASCLAVKDGGCDIDSGNTYYNGLLKGVKSGHCSMADVDKAVANSLRVRFDLGLFDPIEDQPLWKLGAKDIGTAAAKALNLRAAEESLVLLRNPKRVLPLTAGLKIAVLGPHGNATRDLIQVDTGSICADGKMDCVPSPFARIGALNNAAGGSTTYAQGCNLIGTSATDPQIGPALELAKAADVVVLGLGIGSCGSWEMEHNEADAEKVDGDEPWSPGSHSVSCAWLKGGEFLEAEGHDRKSIGTCSCCSCCSCCPWSSCCACSSCSCC